LSKIGAEAAQHALRCVGVVNLPIFPESLADKAPPPTMPGGSGTSGAFMVSAFATRRLRFGSAVTMAAAPFAACADGGPDIAKPIADFVDTVGDWISDGRFSTKTLFTRSAPRASGSF
jgi:hypothetical protein